MARKSRKNIYTMDKKDTKQNTSISYYRTAIYARVSIKSENDCLENQINICKQYVKEHTELKLLEVYQDNGKTGTNFDRPDFQRLLTDVKSQKINCIIVKDLSRFGRNYIETSEYLEKIFPFIGVRFISILDNYDSFIATNSQTSLMVPLKNIINAAYSKDISQKIILSFEARQKIGEFRQPFPPYGYVKSKTDKYRYEIDEKTAPYVRMIFEWKAQGINNYQIANKLNDIGAITPSQRKLEMGLWSTKNNIQSIWSGKNHTIPSILTNLAYIGSVVYGQTKQSLYQGIEHHLVDKSDWLVLPNMHEPIINQELFDTVQDIVNQSKKTTNEKMEQSYEERMKLPNIFKDKIYCADCGSKMFFYRKKNKQNQKYMYEKSYFECGAHEKKKCTPHRIRYNIIYDSVLSSIYNQMNIFAKQQTLLNTIKSLNIRNGENTSEILIKIQKLKTKKIRLLENFTDGILEKEEYLYFKEMYDNELNQLQQQLEIQKHKKQTIDDVLMTKNKWQMALSDTGDFKILDRNLVINLIDKIMVYDSKTINIIFNFQNEKESFENILAELLLETEGLIHQEGENNYD